MNGNIVRAGAPQAAKAAWLGRLNHGRDVWHQYQSGLAASDQMPLRPERLMRALSRALPENAIVAGDVGVHHNWIIQLFDALRPRQLIHSWGFAAMGFATSGILGAKLAGAGSALRRGGRRWVVPDDAARSGDRGGIRHPGGLGGVEQQRLLLDPGHPAWHVRRPRTGDQLPEERWQPRTVQRGFRRLARSFGVTAHTVTHAGEVEDAIKPRSPPTGRI